MLKTVRSNTKRHASIIENAYDAHVHNLRGGFAAEPCSALLIAQYADRSRPGCRHASITDDGSGFYTLHVHGNLWFKFRA